MKILKFDSTLVPLIINGTKTATWRLFDDKNISINDQLQFVNKQSNATFGHATVIHVSKKAIKNITQKDYDAGHEQYTSIDELIQTFKQYYNDQITPESILTIISFKLHT